MSILRIFPRLGVALAALAVCMVALMLYGADRAREESNQWILHTEEVLEGIGSMNESLNRLSVYQLLFLMSGDEEAVAQRNHHYGRLQSLLARIEILTADNPEQQQRIARIRPLLEQRYAVMRDFETQRRQQGGPGRLAIPAPGQQAAQGLSERILAISHEMESMEKRLLAERTARAGTLYRYGLMLLAVIALGSAVVLLSGYAYSRQQRQARRRAERQLQVLADSLPGGLYQARIEAGKPEILLFLSAGMHRLLQEDVNVPLRVSSWMAAMLAEDRPGYLAAMEKARAERGEFRHEYRIRTRSGQQVWVLHQATIREQPDGSLLSNGYVYNITDQVALRQALKNAKEAADRANAAKSVFLATMSHEIRTPMNGVIGTLELLERSDLDDDQRYKLDIVRRSSESLLRLLNDILDFSKIEAGKQSLRLEPVSLRQKLGDLCQLNTGHAAGKGLALHCRVDPRLSPAFLADRLVLRQILSNFLSNAIKFTGEGSVTLAAEFISRDGDIETVRLSVADTGIGISPEEQERLFEPFTQADDVAVRSAGGTGLGLAICQRLIRMLGGTLELQSAPGAGTTISATLPLRIADPSLLVGSPRQEHPPAPANTRESACILVVDDHPINRILMQRQIIELGYAAQCAESGEEGIACWRDGDFSLILTDCSMPDMDGYAMTRAIRAEEARCGRARIPIVASTANAHEDAARTCMAAGMDDCLVKPLKLEQLRQALERWLPDEDRALSSHRAPIDVTVLNELCDGDARVQAELLVQLRASNDKDAAVLRDAFAARDLPQVARAAHRMHGAAVFVGATALAEVCRTLADAGRESDAAVAEATLPRFNAELSRLNTFLERDE